MSDNRVSLYIPCFNVENFIGSCIVGVLSQTYPVDEILIIDDGSQDNTARLASQYPVKLISHSFNKGLAAARNTAFQHASNEFVASLDADCVPDSEWLATLMPLLDDPRVGAVGGRLFETELLCLADHWRRSHLRQDWGDTRVDNPLFMFGNNSVMRKSALTATGGYDEAMHTNGEDADVSKRIRAQGYNLIYEPKAVVSHKRRDTLASILDTYWRYWRFGARAYLGQSYATDLLRHCARHLLIDFGTVISQDVKARDYSLIGIDFLLPGYMIYRDIDAYIKQPSSSC